MPERTPPPATDAPVNRSRARRAAGAAYWRSRRLARRTRARLTRVVRPPEVSIVVPVYNVERYLRACLSSILRQSFRNTEIILIDDGSTDGSTAIAREFHRANWHKVRYYRQENAGLGAARNAGVARARGRYLMFVDSDDTLPRHAVRTMVRTIRRTGSDFVCGAPQRIEDGVARIPKWVTRLHGRADLRTTIWQRPDMILDVFAWNKLWRADFWHQAGLSFPEGLLYEDQIPSARAYLASTSFDVLPDLVYNWITRTGASSITQRTAELENLHDRITVTHTVDEMLTSLGDAEIRRSWLDNRILGNDISLYLKDVDWVSEEYYAAIRRWLAGLFTEDDWRADYESPPMKRLLAWAVVHRDRATVEQLRDLERSNPGGLPTRVHDGGVYVLLGDLDPTLVDDAPENLFRIIDASLELNTNVRHLSWPKPRVLEVGGWAFIRNLDLVQHPTVITVELRNRAGEVVLEAPAEPAPDYRVTRRGINRWTSYDASGFRAQLDLEPLLGAGTGWRQKLQLWVRVRTAGFERSGPMSAPQASGGAKWPSSSPVHEGLKVQLAWERDVLRLLAKEAPLVVSAVTTSGDDVVVEVEATQAPERVYLVKRSKAGRTELPGSVRDLDGSGIGSVTGESPDLGVAGAPAAGLGQRYAVTFAGLQDFLADGSRPRLRAVVARPSAAGSTAPARTRVVPVAVPPEMEDFRDLGNGITARRFASGNLFFEPTRSRVHVHDSEIEGTRWVLTGTAADTDLSTLVLVGPRYQVHPERVQQGESGCFVLTFDLMASEWGEAPRPVAPGFYQLRQDRDRLRVAPADLPAPAPQPALIRWSVQGLRRVPREYVDSRYSVRSSKELTPVVEVLPDIGGDGIGAYYQHSLQRDVYLPAREAEREDAVLFESFHGRHATDNPLALYRELVAQGSDLQMYWSVNDSSVSSPPGATPLVRNSAEWYRVLGSARYLVNNSNWPSAFRKADGQVYLQTWHGTPLKRIGHDIQRVLFSYRNYLEMMDREAASWDALISPNRFCSEIFPHAFSYAGPMLESGYPRNDPLVNDPETGAARARRLLGLEHDRRKIVLYAPTWRDDKFVGAPGRYQAVYHLDFRAFSAALGEDYLILVRGHSNTLLYGRKVNGDAMVDVSRYPEIADLYALADVLVTDYSSVMFDYSVTGKPMLFLAADIADYRDRVRGFYFDFEAEAPGPVFGNTEDLLDHLRHLDRVREQYAERYAAFQRRFNALEDGQASARVVDSVFALAAVPDHAASA